MTHQYACAIGHNRHMSDAARDQLMADLVDRRQVRVSAATAEELVKLCVTYSESFSDDFTADVNGVEADTGVSTGFTVTAQEVRDACMRKATPR